MQENRKKYERLIEILRKEKFDSEEMAEELLSDNMRDSLGELSLADNHPADIGTEVYERARDVAIHDRIKSKVHSIDNALERWEKGEYGTCEHCGAEIPIERLELLPYTTVCTKCSREEEKEEQHSLHREPVENEILNRPFARTFNDGKDKAAFDGEDSWQAVARYGTSNTLQDLGTNRNIDHPNDVYEDSDEWIGAVEKMEVIPTVREHGRGNTSHSSASHTE